MKILLVEPYFGGSHQAWAEGYAAAAGHEVHLLTMPARWWTWRMRGGAVTLAEATVRWVADHGRPDLLLTTDMLDLATYLGNVRRVLADVPAVVYFHESQLLYPWSPKQRPDLAYALTNWTSMLAADLVLFNSEFHRSAVFEHLPALLGQFPDFTHVGYLSGVEEKSSVLPVGVDLAPFDRIPRTSTEPPLIVWNQRWEYDKNPVEFFDALYRLDEEGSPFRVAVCGQNFRQAPDEFVEARRRLADRIVHFGFAPVEGYRHLLRSADIVVSTARQEFFGIAVVEAIYAGAFPLLPRRLSYPEIIPSELHDAVLYDEGALAERLRWALDSADTRAAVTALLHDAVAVFDWSRMAPRYDDALAGLASVHQQHPR